MTALTVPDPVEEPKGVPIQDFLKGMNRKERREFIFRMAKNIKKDKCRTPDCPNKKAKKRYCLACLEKRKNGIID